MDLVLASTSPQRRALLTMLGVSFRVVAPAYDEVPIPGTPEEVVQERARGKARAVAGQTTDRPVLGVDTEVVVEGGGVLGQPADAVEARAMLAHLAGREHRVLSGIALIGQEEQVAVAETRVRLRRLSDEELDAYVARGEWRGRAGGYAIQETGAALVESISGDYANVVGLPVALLGDLLLREGISLIRAGGNADRT